ncbi:MAG TPA: NAD(P)H-dependent oxidoreductase, partial [Nocardioides sp.]
MTDTRIAVLVGSLRADSINRKLAEKLVAEAPEGVVLEIV